MKNNGLTSIVLIFAMVLTCGHSAMAAGGDKAEWPATMNPIAEVVIVGIDSDTLYYIGRNTPSSSGFSGSFPLPRSWYMELIDVLRESKAHVIAVDLLLPAREPTPSVDVALAGTVGEGPPPIVFGFEIIPRPYKVESGINLKRFELPKISASSTSARQAPALALPFKELVDAGASIGCMSALEDADGVIRRANLVVRQGRRVLPSLALQTFMKAAGVSPGSVSISGYPRRVMNVRGVQIPLVEEDSLAVALPPQRTVFPRYSFLDVVHVKDDYLEGNKEAHRERMKDIFEGRVVIVGPTDLSLGDLKKTYAGNGYPGVEVIAATVNHLLNLWSGSRGAGRRKARRVEDELSPLSEEEAVNEALKEMQKIEIKKR